MEKMCTSNGHADLHNHTTASDGLLSPLHLVEYAQIKGLSAVAITDHDTTDGIEEAIAYGNKVGIEIIPGIELNTQYQSCELHILGYYIGYHMPWFQRLLKDIRDSREMRAIRMVDKLNELYHFHLSYTDIEKEADGGAIARPHIARVLVKKGIAEDLSDAFVRFIGNHCPAYVDRYRLTPEEGIHLIKKVGGVPVLAHPGLIEDSSLVDYVIKQGIKGLEVFHSKHTLEKSTQFMKMANDHELLVTGGSDCHGDLINGEPSIGTVTVPYDTINKLKKLASSIIYE